MGLTGLTVIDCDELKHFDTFLIIFFGHNKKPLVIISGFFIKLS